MVLYRLDAVASKDVPGFSRPKKLLKFAER